MKVRHKKCPACLSLEIEEIENYKSFPAILFPIEPHKRQSVPESGLSVFLCGNCNHLFLNDVDSEFNNKIYEDHYYLYPFKDLESMQGAYREPFEKIFNLFYKGGGGTLLEIGCDNEQQMKQFTDLGIQCTAINPGVKKSSKIKFINGFYGECVIPGSFNFIVSRFNLEHVLDLELYLDHLNNNLKTEGVGFIQVPNMEMFLVAGLLNVFAHEHPHYFCRKSISALLARFSFDVLYLSETVSPSIICVFKKSAEMFEPHRLLKAKGSIIESINAFLTTHSNTSVVFFGAGLTLTAILYLGKIDHTRLSNVQVVDDNPILHGRFMPNTDIQIYSLSEVVASENTVVLLTLSPAYYKQVIAKLESVKLAAVYGISSEGIYRIR